MRIAAEPGPFVVSVDTHGVRHSFTVIDVHKGVVVDQSEFPATGAVFPLAVDWKVRRGGFSQVSLVAVEGTTRLTKSARESLSVPHVGMPA